MNKKIIVAIDGFSSCGKSTIAKTLAKDTDYLYIDTGAMYRAIAYYCVQNKLITSESINQSVLASEIENIKVSFKKVGVEQHTFVNDIDVEPHIRTLELGNAASRVSAIGFVRKEMVRQQQLLGAKKGIVMDGRDIGTVVFPEAELKIFVTASIEQRAKRRYNELIAKGDDVDYQSVLENLNERDHRDTNRSEGPLFRAEDAILLDNTLLSIEQQQKMVYNWFVDKFKVANNLI